MASAPISDELIGIATILFAGVLAGIYFTPMRLAPKFSHENTWLIYSMFGLVILPSILCVSTLPDFWDIYSKRSEDVLKVVIFGFLWGIGSLAFGMGVNAVGQSLGYSMILGMTACLGSVIPLVALHYDSVWTTKGLLTFASLPVTCVGLFFLAVAGHMKGKEQDEYTLLKQKDEELETSLLSEGEASTKSSFFVGLCICFLSGVTSPCINIGLAIGNGIKDEAVSRGHSEFAGNNGIWALILVTGGLLNALYCVFLLFKNGTWSKYWQEPAGANIFVRVYYFFTGILMGTLWFGGNVIYGVGSNVLGDLGTVIGFPIFLILMVVTGNASGIMFGEWGNTQMKSKLLFAVGMASLLLAVGILSLASVFGDK